MSFFDLHIYESLASTNLLVRERIEANEREGFVALAFEQTAGYGRMGRTWVSPAGGLYMSVLLRPNVYSSVLPTISFLVAIAVRRALSHVLQPAQLERVKFKWPNDIVLAGERDKTARADKCAICSEFAQGVKNVQGTKSATRAQSEKGVQTSNTYHHRFNKLVGISQELVHGALCIGIGANVFRPIIPQNVTGKNTPAYIAELAQKTSLPEIAYGSQLNKENVASVGNPDAHVRHVAKECGCVVGDTGAHLNSQQAFITHLAHLILQELEPAYVAWQSRGFEPFLGEYQRHMCLHGQHIQMQNQLGEQTLEGKVVGTNSSGQLLLVAPDGNMTTVASGEVTLI